MQARNEKIEQLENDLILAEKVSYVLSLVSIYYVKDTSISVINIFLQEVDRFRELYLEEQEQKLDLQSDLNDCKVSIQLELLFIAYFLQFCAYES